MAIPNWVLEGGPELRVHAWPARAGEGDLIAVVFGRVLRYTRTKGIPLDRPEDAPIREAWVDYREDYFGDHMGTWPPDGLYVYVESKGEIFPAPDVTQNYRDALEFGMRNPMSFFRGLKAWAAPNSQSLRFSRGEEVYWLDGRN